MRLRRRCCIGEESAHKAAKPPQLGRQAPVLPASCVNPVTSARAGQSYRRHIGCLTHLACCGWEEVPICEGGSRGRHDGGRPGVGVGRALSSRCRRRSDAAAAVRGPADVLRERQAVGPRTVVEGC